MLAARLQDISYRYAAGWVLLHVNVSLPVGGRALLVGDNGSGKTTLLRLLSTSLSPTHGQVHLFGQPAKADVRAVRQRLALMTHQHFFYEPLSAAQNLRLVAQLRRPEHTDRVHEHLAEVGLLRHADAPVGGFSAGMKRRLALARVLLLEPELILWDEPFGQLDQNGIELVERVLDRLQQRRVSWVMATHDIDRGRRHSTLEVRLAHGTAHTQPAGELS